MWFVITCILFSVCGIFVAHEVRARALLCPLTGKGQPVSMAYRKLTIGTGKVLYIVCVETNFWQSSQPLKWIMVIHYKSHLYTFTILFPLVVTFEADHLEPCQNFDCGITTVLHGCNCPMLHRWRHGRVFSRLWTLLLCLCKTCMHILWWGKLHTVSLWVTVSTNFPAALNTVLIFLTLDFPSANSFIMYRFCLN